MKPSRRNLTNAAKLKDRRLGGPPKLSKYAAKVAAEWRGATRLTVDKTRQSQRGDR